MLANYLCARSVSSTVWIGQAGSVWSGALSLGTGAARRVVCYRRSIPEVDRLDKWGRVRIEIEREDRDRGGGVSGEGDDDDGEAVVAPAIDGVGGDDEGVGVGDDLLDGEPVCAEQSCKLHFRRWVKS